MHDATFPHRFVALGVMIAGMIACWVLITPIGGGPDEPSHLIRAGAVARAQFDGVRVDGADLETFDLPDTYAFGDIGCYAFQPEVAATCAPMPATTGAVVALPTRSENYPVWGHLPAGLASRLPGLHPVWWGRIGGALVPTILLAWSLAALGPRRPLASAGVLLAATPMAWFTFGIVNPSSMAIAGGIALWTALLARTRVPWGWLTACGWAALALPRRDGLIWACLSLAIALIATNRPIDEWWRALRIGPRIVIGASTIATLLWGITNDSRVSRLVVLAPLIVATSELARWWWQTRARTPAVRRATTEVWVMLAALGTVVVVAGRPGGWDSDLAERVVGETGNNLVEAIGVLGWLDTTLPAPVIIAWLIALGSLAGISLLDARWPLRTAASVLLLGIVTSWIFELYQGNTSGTYWQGRYSVPLLVGVPIVLGSATASIRNAALVGRAGIAIALVVTNAALVALGRRFGVGVSGSLLPWNWDTYDAPVAPVALIGAHLACSVGVALVLFRSPQPENPAQAAAR